MKNLLITITLSLSAVLSAYAQINFKDRDLAILENIAFTTSYKTLKGFMKENNYSFQDEVESELPLENDGYLEAIFLDFKGSIGNTIIVCYGKKDRTFIGVVNQIARLNTVFYENELESKLFKIKEENDYVKVWSKSSYKHQIATDKSDEKIHALMLISPSHPEYIK